MLNPNQELFSFKQITKRFGSVLANEEVSFAVQKGTIHGVVGENGAGKSTIMKILYGMYTPDSGTIHFKGQPKEISDPEAAIALGIGMVHQHFMLVPTLTVWENIILGKEPSLWVLNKKEILKKLEALKTSFGFHLNLEARVETLAVGQQQQVEILKLLYRDADLLILDEPTAVLTPQETYSLFEKLKKLRDNHKTIVVITHKLKEILNFTDFLTIMRQGRSIETLPTQSLNETTLAEKIIGRKRIPLTSIQTTSGKEPVLTVKEVSLQNPNGVSLENVSFQILPGEIVGIAGIEGNGQQELIEILANVRKDYQGTVLLNSKGLSQFSTYDLRQQGFSLIPSDRHQEAVVLSFSIAENSILGHHREKTLKKGPFLSNSKIEELASHLIESFDVRPNDPKLPLSSLSGGNQQKLVVARETSRPITFLLASHPTRGIDIGAMDFIHEHFLKLKADGAAILLISSELDEILKLSDRILVISQGALVAEVEKEKVTESQLGLWMTSGAKK